MAGDRGPGAELKLTREIVAGEEQAARRDEVLIAGFDARRAVADFAAGKSDLVLGGTFADLPFAQRTKLPRNALHYDPASGLFGLVPGRADGPLADAELRRLLSQGIDRDALVAALKVPGLAARPTVLEPELEGTPAPTNPPSMAIPIRPASTAPRGSGARDVRGQSEADTEPVAGARARRRHPVQPPERRLGRAGVTVERAKGPAGADLRLVDRVAPSASAAWFLRQFRCQSVPLCDADADTLLDAARQTLIPAQRYALLSQAASRIDDAQLFIPLAAPVRWSLVSRESRGSPGTVTPATRSPTWTKRRLETDGESADERSAFPVSPAIRRRFASESRRWKNCSNACS